MKRLAACFILATATLCSAGDDRLMTVAESSEFTETSTYNDVVTFLHHAARQSPTIRLARLGTSAEGREIPMVVVSNKSLATAAEARSYQLPAVLLVANIHAGEVEGKEALQMLLRDVVEHHVDRQLDNQVLLVVPIFNADGNDKLGNSVHSSAGGVCHPCSAHQDPRQASTARAHLNET